MQIILVATAERICSVAALKRLLIQDPRLANALLLRPLSAAFCRQGVVNTLKQRIAEAGLSESNYSGHNFQEGAAKHEADHGMLDERIKRLGRWTSNAFKLYFTTTPETLFSLNLSFQKTIPLAVPRETM